MDDLEYRIREILKQLLDGQGINQNFSENSEKPSLYVINGLISHSLLEQFQLKYRIIVLDDYDAELYRSLKKDDCLCIAQLSLSDLAKVALGIADTTTSLFLSQAIIHNLPTYILEEGIENYGSNQAYREQVICYQRKVKSFGLKILTRERLKQQLLNHNTISKSVLTLSDIKDLTYGSEIVVMRNTVITYSAKELIKEKMIRVRYDKSC